MAKKASTKDKAPAEPVVVPVKSILITNARPYKVSFTFLAAEGDLRSLSLSIGVSVEIPHNETNLARANQFVQSGTIKYKIQNG